MKQGRSGERTRQPRTAKVRRRTRRSPEEIRRLLLDAARAEFRAKGYAGATTAAISKRAGVAEIQMFRYFPSKGQLFQEAVFAPLREHFRSFNARHATQAVDPDSTHRHARQYLNELLAFLQEHSEMLVSLFVAQTYATSVIDRTANSRKYLQSFFEEAARSMTTRTPRTVRADAAAIVRVAFGSILGCVTYREWLFPSGRRNDELMQRALAEFVLTGIAPYSDVGAPSKPRAAQGSVMRSKRSG